MFARLGGENAIGGAVEDGLGMTRNFEPDLGPGRGEGRLCRQGPLQKQIREERERKI